MTYTFRFPGDDREDPVLECGPGMTEQYHKDDVEIHSIMAKYQKTGIINHVSKYGGTYGDFINAPDYEEAQIAIANANTMFAELPSSVRERCENDPRLFLEWVQNPENRSEIEELGLSTEHLPEPVVQDPGTGGSVEETVEETASNTEAEATAT